MLFLPITAMVRRMMFVFAWISIWWIVGLCNRDCGNASCRPFNQLVEFTAIKPNTAALGAVVNFNALAFGHQQAGVRADGAFHRVPSRKVEPSTRFWNSPVFDYLEY